VFKGTRLIPARLEWTNGETYTFLDEFMTEARPNWSEPRRMSWVENLALRIRQ
jgi:hypothetical protein